RAHEHSTTSLRCNGGTVWWDLCPNQSAHQLVEQWRDCRWKCDRRRDDLAKLRIRDREHFWWEDWEPYHRGVGGM
ncbi:MAG TPA: hypothetical protein VN039_00880, partial [Nitrospira sp.]|nr:hypothetical protein [Nitrospira sp.]